MRIEELKNNKVKDFIEYCRKYREELSDEYIGETFLEKFIANEENPTYIVLDDNENVIGAVSLIIDAYHREGKIGRFRIFHSKIEEAYELMLSKIIKHTEGLKSIFLFIKEEDKKRSEILEGLNFIKDGYSYTLLREALDICDAKFPEGFEVRTFQAGRDESDWCEVRNIGFPEDIPRTPDNVCLYWEVDPSSHLEGGMFLLYNKNKPVGTIRASIEVEDGISYTYISVVCINPEYRKNGLATNMLRVALNFGKNKGYDKAMLCVDPDNEKAIDIYLREGFKKIYGSLAYVYKL